MHLIEVRRSKELAEQDKNSIATQMLCVDTVISLVEMNTYF